MVNQYLKEKSKYQRHNKSKHLKIFLFIKVSSLAICFLRACGGCMFDGYLISMSDKCWGLAHGMTIQEEVTQREIEEKKKRKEKDIISKVKRGCMKTNSTCLCSSSVVGN